MAKNENGDYASPFAEDGDLIDEALNSSLRDALLEHKRTGDPVVVWKDGRVTWIPADEIVVDEPIDVAPDAG